VHFSARIPVCFLDSITRSFRSRILGFRTIGQAASRRLPTVAVQVQFQVRMCGGQIGVGVRFVRVIAFLYKFSFHRVLHIHQSFDHRRCMVWMLTASLSNLLRNLELLMKQDFSYCMCRNNICSFMYHATRL
jgi:hypothetical protein